MKTKTKKPIAVDYEHRAKAAQVAAGKAEIKTINEAYDRFDAAAKTVEQSTVDGVNAAREIGLHLQTLCGHEQVTFDFWRDHCDGKIKFSFERAKLFISVARKLKQPAENIQQAACLIQTCLIANGALELPQRTTVQSLSKVGTFQRFFAELTLVKQPFQKALRECPMDKWDNDTLDTFIFETEFFRLENERAVELRKARA